VGVAQTPSTAEAPGTEEIASGISSTGALQSRASFFSAANGQFRRDLFIAGVAIAGIASHLVLRFSFGVPGFAQVLPLYAVLLFGGLPLVFRLVQKSFAREFGSDLLAGISIVASALMGQYLVGSIVVLMLSGGTVL
jgi:cation transport ATPase